MSTGAEYLGSSRETGLIIGEFRSACTSSGNCIEIGVFKSACSAGGDCIEAGVWNKATASKPDGNCVETSLTEHEVLVRDSKEVKRVGERARTLRFSLANWLRPR